MSIKLYPKMNQFLKENKITEEELNIILTSLPNKTVSTFMKFYHPDKDSVQDERETIFAEMKIVYAAVDDYKVQKSLQGIVPVKNPKKRISKKYSDIDEIIKKNNLVQEELDQIIAELPRNEKISFIYTHGMDGRPILSIDKLATILKCNAEDVKSYLSSAYHRIEMYAENKKQTNRNKLSQRNLLKNRDIIPVKIYKDKTELLEHFQLTMEEFESITKNWSFEQITSFCYVNGIDRKKLTIDQTAKLLNYENHKIRKYLKDSNDMLEEYKQKKDDIKTRIDRNRKKTLLERCKEEDKRYLLKAIEYWKDNNFKNYNVIIKLCGSNYDGWNEDAYQQLNEEEKRTWKSITGNIFQTIESAKRREKTGKRRNSRKIGKNSKNENIVVQDENEIDTIDTLILYEKASHMDISDDILCKSIRITIEQLDDCYSKYLHLFGNQIPSIIKRMITRNPSNVDKILTKSYLRDYLQYLTVEEQIYLYLKLQSYANEEITDAKIAYYMKLMEKDIQDYKIMTPYEELNMLNELIKSKRKRIVYKGKMIDFSC